MVRPLFWGIPSSSQVQDIIIFKPLQRRERDKCIQYHPWPRVKGVSDLWDGGLKWPLMGRNQGFGATMGFDFFAVML